MRSEWARVVLDTSGPALKAALAEGVTLVKPNLGELRALAGMPLESETEQVSFCQRIIAERGVEVVALTLAERGALVVTGESAWRLKAPQVKVESTVGAGDSFVGAFVWSLASGHDLALGARYAVAAGTAALLAPGTELCRRDDAEDLLSQVEASALDL